MKPVILGLACAALCSGATYYVRPSGGTGSQCNGTANASYPGSGANRDCAWAHPYWALDGAAAWKIRGGDTLLIEPGSYAIGYDAPNTAWCTREGAFACTLPALPSGPSPQSPTRLMGTGWNSGCAAPPELWGTQRVFTILNLDKTSNAQIDCLEITDHSSCVESHANPSVRCERDRYPYGEWGAIGIYAAGSANVTLRHLNIHGLAHTGIQAGRLTDWTVEDVRIAVNGYAGWDGDLGGADSSNSGTLLFRRWKVEWNGCAETWPGRQPDHCWAQHANGYGDGVGTAATSGHWIIEDSEFSHNTSDGLDLLYVQPVRGERPNVEIRRTMAYGNAGNQIKAGGTSSIVNTLVVGNCAFFLNKPFAQEMGGIGTEDQCRAFGNAVALFPHRGDTVSVVNSTIVGQGDVLVDSECGIGNGLPPCDRSERVTLQNNVLAGYGDVIAGDAVGLIYDPDGLATGRIDNNVIFHVKETPCPAGASNICADPMFVNGSLESFDGRLRDGSPAIDSGIAASSLNGLVPAEDLASGARPAGSGVDRGAYEFGAEPGAPLIEGIVSAASGQTNSVAPRALLSFYGRRFATAAQAASTLPYPATLAGIQLFFGERAAGLVYVSDGLINVLVPDLEVGASVPVTVRRGSLRSYQAAYDLDHDGYADLRGLSADLGVDLSGLIPKNPRFLMDAPNDQCPFGTVPFAGDCDGWNPAVNPGRGEIGFNGLDDNCSGKTDEPTIYYQAAGVMNTNSSFRMLIYLNHPDILASARSGTLFADVKYARLSDSATPLLISKTPVGSFGDSYAYAQLDLNHLSAGTVYRAYVTFFRRNRDATFTQVGPNSNWYYTMTDHPDWEVHRRFLIVLKGLAEFFDSLEGRVGYRGTVQPEGTRYGALLDQGWCSDFYTWVTQNWLPGIFGIAHGLGIPNYFRSHDSYYSATEIPRRAEAGDYLYVDSDRNGQPNHTALFLAFDASSDLVWTLEGNYADKVMVVYRPAGFLEHNPPFVGLGHITSGML